MRILPLPGEMSVFVLTITYPSFPITDSGKVQTGVCAPTGCLYGSPGWGPVIGYVGLVAARDS